MYDTSKMFELVNYITHITIAITIIIYISM